MTARNTGERILYLALVFLLLCLQAGGARAQADSVRDTTRIETPPTARDSIIEQTKDDVAEILKFIHGEEADSADTIQTPIETIVPPSLRPEIGFVRQQYSFAELAALPHIAFSDHLLGLTEFGAAATTEYGTERRFLYRGLTPLGVGVSLDGVTLDLRRPTFPQTMAPDLTVIPPYAFSSVTATGTGTNGRLGENIAAASFDSLVGRPYSDFFVRRGDYGMSLTQGRLYRPLPGGRTVNFGFCFAQSAGRGADWFDAGDNRYLFAKFITPVYRGYNLVAGWRQYQNDSDIQTPEDFRRYHFLRDDLSWGLEALIFHGNKTHSPWLFRLVYDHDKFDIKSESSGNLQDKWGSYSTYLKKSRAEFEVTYTPQPMDSTGGRRAGARIALQQMSIGAGNHRRPAYTLWAEQHRRLTEHHAAYLSLAVSGNDEDAPAPEISSGWSYTPAENFQAKLTLRRQRLIPSLADRQWPASTAVFENLDEQVFTYTESGDVELSSWWSNSVTGELDYRPGKRVSLGLTGWASTEQDYYYWTDLDAADTSLDYQPYVTEARTAGAALFTTLFGPGSLATRVTYGFKRAEEPDGRRLPDYIDHKVTAVSKADLTVRRFNLELHGAVEFMYWRAPSAEYTDYNRRDVWRADVLGSATIKDFTIYWLAQNLFNYGYRRAPGDNFLGQTIMWGLHLRFYN